MRFRHAIAPAVTLVAALGFATPGFAGSDDQEEKQSGSASSAAEKPSYKEADQNGDGKVTLSEAKAVGVREKSAKMADIDDNKSLTKNDWQFVDLQQQS